MLHATPVLIPEVLNSLIDEHKEAGSSIYYSPLRFYEKNGFEVFSKIRFDQKHISAVKISWVKG